MYLRGHTRADHEAPKYLRIWEAHSDNSAQEPRIAKSAKVVVALNRDGTFLSEGETRIDSASRVQWHPNPNTAACEVPLLEALVAGAKIG
jgi:hypothetical protein